MKAKEMFKKLGYKKISDSVNWLIYNFDEIFEIRFYKPQQDISIYYYDETVNSIDMEELQAIIQQCKELGWLEEENK